MGNALRPRWLFLLAGVGALVGCAQMPGGSAYPPIRLDPHLAAERYLSPAADPDGVAQTHTLETAWTKMGNGSPAASAPPVARASREEAVIRTSSLQTSAAQQPAAPAVSTSGTGIKRSLYDKQPWEVELDNIVRGICRGC